MSSEAGRAAAPAFGRRFQSRDAPIGSLTPTVHSIEIRCGLVVGDIARNEAVLVRLKRSAATPGKPFTGQRILPIWFAPAGAPHRNG